MSMEKYGVKTDEDDDGEKRASQADKCPVCGATVEIAGNVRRCPVHGTKPFEK